MLTEEGGLSHLCNAFLLGCPPIRFLDERAQSFEMRDRLMWQCQLGHFCQVVATQWLPKAAVLQD